MTWARGIGSVADVHETPGSGLYEAAPAVFKGHDRLRWRQVGRSGQDWGKRSIGRRQSAVVVERAIAGVTRQVTVGDQATPWRLGWVWTIGARAFPVDRECPVCRGSLTTTCEEEWL
jgi:hypothetical protein